jgi:hypothetical protein
MMDKEGVPSSSGIDIIDEETESDETPPLRPINAWLLLALPTLDLICPRESRARLNISSVLPFECVLAFE